MGLFVVFYIAFDSIVGIANGILVYNAQSLTNEQQATIVGAIKDLVLNPIVGDISVISILGGGFGWVMGVFAAALALYRTSAPPIAVILLALSFIFASHPRPTGPLGMMFFCLAAVWTVPPAGTTTPGGTTVPPAGTTPPAATPRTSP